MKYVNFLKWPRSHFRSNEPWEIFAVFVGRAEGWFVEQNITLSSLEEILKLRMLQRIVGKH